VYQYGLFAAFWTLKHLQLLGKLTLHLRR
jgi:hypothetical protein